MIYIHLEFGFKDGIIIFWDLACARWSEVVAIVVHCVTGCYFASAVCCILDYGHWSALFLKRSRGDNKASG